MTTRLFLRLSTRAADHGKKPPLKEPESAIHSSKGKRLPSEQAKELKKDLTLNKSLWKKEAKTSTSQSCTSLTKLTHSTE
jgi:hypothetical protein